MYSRLSNETKEVLNRLDELMSRYFLGVHPDELWNPHYAYDIVEVFRHLTEEATDGLYKRG